MAETVETAIYRLQIEGQDQLDKMKASVDGLAVSEEKATASNRTYSEALQASLAKYDPLLRAQAQYQKALEQNERYREAGVGTEAQLSAQLEASTAKYMQQKAAIEGLGNAHKGLDSQGQAAFHSMRSLLEQIAMGVPITQALTQQFNHLSYAASGEGGIVGAFKQVGSFITGMINPTTAAIAAVTALGAAALYAANQFDKLQVSSQRAISGAGARTGTSVGDINKFVQQNAGQGTGVSDKEARDLAEAWTKSGDIIIGQLHDVGTALVGFANQTSSSVTDASKAFEAFGKDPAKALQAFKDAFGALDQTTQHSIQTLIEAGDKTGALQAIFNAYSGQLKDAANNMTFMEKATRALIVAMGGVPKFFLPEGVDTQIAKVKQGLDNLIASAENAPDNFLPGISKGIVDLTQKLIDLQAQSDKTKAATATAVSNDIADKANAATRALDPEIAQLEALRQKIKEIEAAQAAGMGTPAMITALERARQKVDDLTKSMDAGAVAWQQYAQQSATNVAALGSAATAAEQAQAKIDALTASYAAGKIQVDVYSRAVQGVRDAYQATIPVTQDMIAAQASLGDLMRQNIGGAITLPDITRQAAGSARDLANNFQDAGVQGKVLYDGTNQTANSLDSAVGSAGSLANNLAGGAQDAGQMANNLASAAQSASSLGSSLAGIYAKGNDPFASLLGDQSGGGGASVQPLVLTPKGYYPANDAAGFAIAAAQQAGTLGKVDPQTLIDMAAQGGVDAAIATLSAGGSAYSSAVQQLYGLKISGATDNAGKIAATQQEIGYLQGQPASLANLTQITSLQQSLEQLKSSTDTLNSTNTTTNELLSPYYNQDPRTSHIGFRSQGMAGGGFVDVPGGYSANDNMVASISVASGERIFVDPMNARRGITSNSGNTINLMYSPVIYGNAGDKDAIGRTLFQSNQTMAKQMRAALQ